MNNDQEKIDSNFGPIALNELKKILPNTNKSAETIELTDSTDTHIDDIVFSSENTVNNIEPSSLLSETVDRYVEILDHVEKQVISTDCEITATENSRHIMISYNESSFDICQKIYQGLQNAGYKVWIDEYDLHGRIFQEMAKAIENASIVLVCYNEKYAASDYCCQEATYAFDNRIDFIPCRLQESYRPKGWLGNLIADRLYIDFSPPNTFESAFEKLLEEIKSIKTPAQTYACSSPCSPTSIRNENIREKFDTIIREYQQSLARNDYQLESLNQQELCELIVLLRERLCNHTPAITNECTQTQQKNDQILKDLFQQSRNQTALLANINTILSKPTDIKTVAKLSLAVLFVWTVKTHIIDACLKAK